MSQSTAHKLKTALERKGINLKLGQVYDLIAEVNGFKNHHAAKASGQVIGLYASTDPIDEAGLVTQTNKIGEDGLYQYDVKFEQRAVLSMSLEVKAKNITEAYKLALNHVENNVNNCVDDTDSWGLEHLIGGTRVLTDIHNWGLRAPRYNYVKKCWEKMTKEEHDKQRLSSLHVQNHDGIGPYELMQTQKTENGWIEAQYKE